MEEGEGAMMERRRHQQLFREHKSEETACAHARAHARARVFFARARCKRPKKGGAVPKIYLSGYLQMMVWGGYD